MYIHILVEASISYRQPYLFNILWYQLIMKLKSKRLILKLPKKVTIFCLIQSLLESRDDNSLKNSICNDYGGRCN